jgi:hypothetical protein
MEGVCGGGTAQSPRAICSVAHLQLSVVLAGYCLKAGWGVGGKREKGLGTDSSRAGQGERNTVGLTHPPHSPTGVLVLESQFLSIQKSVTQLEICNWPWWGYLYY